MTGGTAENVTTPAVRRCWCGGQLERTVGPHYRQCTDCGAAVLTTWPDAHHFDVSDDERDFYGKHYWTDYSRARHLPDIAERAQSDLSERCLFWLERLIEVARPPGRVLEVGCGHGGFVRMMREVGFDAIGTELSRWVVDFARRTFDIPVLRGRLETLDLEPGFACIAAFDVLEHLEDPVATVRRCGELLAPDGVLLLQTPWYRGEASDWSMFQEDEHIHLFTEESVRRLLRRAGFDEIVIRPSLFPYDMWIVASRERGRVTPANARHADDGWRPPVAFRALLDLARQARALRETLTAAEADRVARLSQVEELTAQLQVSEMDRSARFEQLEQLTHQVRELETARREDAGARREDENKLTTLLKESEVDRAARLEQIQELSRLLQESDLDRTARLEQIQELSRLIHESEQRRLREQHDYERQLAERQDSDAVTERLRVSEADRAARLEQIDELSKRLQKSEADRTARLEQIDELSKRLQKSEADRTARLEQIHELSRRLRDSDADRAARLAQVEELSRQLAMAEADRAARLAQAQELSRLLRESDADRAARLDVIQSLQAEVAGLRRRLEQTAQARN